VQRHFASQLSQTEIRHLRTLPVRILRRVTQPPAPVRQ
jgi:hypothetical protein